MNLNATILGQSIAFAVFEMEVPINVETVEAEIEMEVQRAKEELRAQVAAIAVAGAEKILENSVDQAANEELVKKLASEL